jgi:hypothetical protein
VTFCILSGGTKSRTFNTNALSRGRITERRAQKSHLPIQKASNAKLPFTWIARYLRHASHKEADAAQHVLIERIDFVTKE